MFNYEKKISIGYCTGETFERYDMFFQKYHKYIHNIYFSMPLGDRFHARARICSGLRSNENIELMWRILKRAKEYGIQLEVVFNTPNLNMHDFVLSYNELKSRNIDVDLVGILDKYYYFASKVFKGKELVHSFNNFYNSIDDYRKNSFKYDQYVIGRQNIRDSALFRFLSDEKHAKVVLLVNNGCSFKCGGCKSNPIFCHNAYFSQLHHKTPEELYAIQSIMPFELNDKLLDTSCIHYIKISTRNSGLDYASNSIDSYISSNERDLITKSPENYSLWGRQTWHGEFYETFNFDKIVEIKRNIYSKLPIEFSASLKNKCYVMLDSSNAFHIFMLNWKELQDFIKNNSYYFSVFNVSGVIINFFPSDELKLAIETFAQKHNLEIHYLISSVFAQNYNCYKFGGITGIYCKNIFNHAVKNDFTIYNGLSKTIYNFNDLFLKLSKLPGLKYVIAPMPTNGVLLKHDEPLNLKLTIDLYFSDSKFYIHTTEGVLKTMSEGRFDLVLRL